MKPRFPLYRVMGTKAQKAVPVRKPDACGLCPGALRDLTQRHGKLQPAIFRFLRQSCRFLFHVHFSIRKSGHSSSLSTAMNAS